MKRTSLSHPLKISEVQLANGVIGLTFCPGKADDCVYGTPWMRDLGIDIRSLRNWGASTVITLIEHHEFDILHVPHLGQAIQAAGMEWIHLPIRDVSIPDDNFSKLWANVSLNLQRRLAQGERIVFHCRAGLGRTGLVAALLLLDHGWAALSAIREVRRARPGAIMTKKQEKYIHRYVPYLCHASLMAGAIGDSLGADIEFASLPDIRAKFPNGVNQLAQTHAVAPGWFTDDTQMTLFTAEGLIRAYVHGALKGISSYAGVVHHALIRWYLTQRGISGTPYDNTAGLVLDRRMWHRAAPGLTCTSALAASQYFGDKAQNDSKGCGAIMRVAPVAFAVHRMDVRRTAIETSALTHGHPIGQLAAAAWAEILADVLLSCPLDKAASDVARDYRRGFGPHGETIANAINAALEAPTDGSPKTVETLGAGWVAEEALSIALYAALIGKSFEHGLRIAVTHSGDTDSTAAIAGNMLGLMYPDQVFAHRWFSEVGGRDLIAPIALCLPYARHWGTKEAALQSAKYPGF